VYWGVAVGGSNAIAVGYSFSVVTTGSTTVSSAPGGQNILVVSYAIADGTPR